MPWNCNRDCRRILSSWAVDALVNEAELAPKPGLVDPGDTGAHQDMTFDLMVDSAHSLQGTFELIADVSYKGNPDQQLREEIAAIGREGEKRMLAVTGGVNTHKGAIWVLGLLISGLAVNKPGEGIERIVQTASLLSRYPDRYAPDISSHGSRLYKKFGVKGARGEAMDGFPNLLNVALPQLDQSRRSGISEHLARLNTLVALIAHLEDTCILHRGGEIALQIAQEKAHRVLGCGGVSTQEGWEKLKELNKVLLTHRASPGGSADLLAATLYLDRIRNVQYVGEKEALYTT